MRSLSLTIGALLGLSIATAAGADETGVIQPDSPPPTAAEADADPPGETAPEPAMESAPAETASVPGTEAEAPEEAEPASAPVASPESGPEEAALAEAGAPGTAQPDPDPEGGEPGPLAGESTPTETPGGALAEAVSGAASTDDPAETGLPEAAGPATPTATVAPVDGSAALRAAPATVTTARGHVVRIGPRGTDAFGHHGRLHTVASGDTLWDIAAAYLGTPWVWPSIWHENEDIANPHRIDPGDLIWITSTEMRRVTPDEAQALLVAADQPAPGEEALDEEPGPAAPEPRVGSPEPAAPEEGLARTVEIDLPTALDDIPVATPIDGHGSEDGRTIRVPSRDTMSFVTSETYEAASSIVANPFGRTWLATGDIVHIGLGAGEVEEGDEFTLFRDADPVRDMNEDLLGYHVEILGWLVVREVHPEVATAEIRMAVGESRIGDRLVPREALPSEVSMRRVPPGFEGRVIHMPDDRTVVAQGDYLYLDRGSIHGLEVGSVLQVFSEGGVKREVVTRRRVHTPDVPVADLVVVSVRPDSSVAVVTHAVYEIVRGDKVGTPVSDLARRR